MSEETNKPETNPELENALTAFESVRSINEEDNEFYTEDSAVSSSEETQVVDSKPFTFGEKQNITVEKEPTYPLKDGKINERATRVYFPPCGFGDFTRFTDLMKNQEADPDWVDAVNGGMRLNNVADVYHRTLDEEGGDWHQSAKHPSRSIRAVSVMKRTLPAEGTVVSGEKALMSIRSFLDIGSPAETVLFNSGIVLSIKAPSEAELLTLHKSITNKKSVIGRATMGIAFSNSTVFNSESVVGVILQNLYSTSLKVKEDLLDRILVTDIPTMLTGLASAIHPAGFQYERACIANVNKCNHVIKENIRPDLMVFENRAKLTDFHLNHLAASKTASKDSNDIIRYQEQLSTNQKREVTVNGGNGKEVRIVMAVPNLLKYFTEGNIWVDGIRQAAIKALGRDVEDDRFDTFMSELASATYLRTFSAWFEEIEFGGQIIKDIETIRSTLDVLSSDNDIRKKLNAEVTKYIGDSTVTVVGVPDYECPMCKGGQIHDKDNPNLLHRHIVPIDVLHTFFELLTQRVEQMVARSGETDDE